MRKAVISIAGPVLILSALAPNSGQSQVAPTSVRSVLESHQIVARSCTEPRGFRRIHIKAGRKFAREGEVFGFEPRVIRAEPCEEVEIVLENTDSVRHALMLPGLNPMFLLEFSGPQTRRLRYVTPDEDITLDFHCHVPGHEKMGMFGQLVVGRGGEKVAAATVEAAGTEKRLYEGIGTVIAVDPRRSQLVVDHEEIEGFMAAMIMGYKVAPASLLQGLEPGRRVRFTIDADKEVIVKVISSDE